MVILGDSDEGKNLPEIPLSFRFNSLKVYCL